MSKHRTMDVDMLRELLAYDADTGLLLWRERPPDRCATSRRAAAWNARYSGKEAFTCLNGHGYRIGNIFGRGFLAHRVAWAIFYGEWPTEDIDHINGVRSDNKLCNLRSVSHHDNQRNMALRADNTSGVVGVSWYKATGKWQANIRIDKKTKGLGHFESFEEAVSARKEAEVRHGYHTNHGRAS